MSITAMKQALEALEECVYWYGARDKEEQLMSTDNQNREIKKSIEAITSLREAIAKAEEA